jgi:molybdopterin-guanine dinucleotide biosynthesis protein A
MPSLPRKKPLPVSGYVLAGGRSSRMGTDKALLRLAGKPLIEHAVAKLRRVCADVDILSSNPALAAYAPLVPDLHPDCGPISGIEAALIHSRHDWSLILPVDMPFMPTAYIDDWARLWTSPPFGTNHSAAIHMFTVSGRPQPGFCLLHQDVAPIVSHSILCGEYALMPVFERAGRELGALRGPDSASALWGVPFADPPLIGPMAELITPAQFAARSLWFANLNTPGDFALAEAHIDALDT